VPQASLDDPRASMLSEGISDGKLRDIYIELIQRLISLHEEIKLSCSDLEVRISFRGALIARVVPYRELLHIRVGDAPGWEVRVREEQGYLETLDLAIHQFLRVVSTQRPPLA
jgi:hypothetical protein